MPKMDEVDPRIEGRSCHAMDLVRCPAIYLGETVDEDATLLLHDSPQTFSYDTH